MAKWEYLTVEVGYWGDLEAELDGYGRDGWEAVGLDRDTWGMCRVLLKRALVEGE